jgi:hypothetical protein
LISIRTEGESNSIQTTSDHQIISVEEPTGNGEFIFVKNVFFIFAVSCQLVRETSYTEAEGMDCMIHYTNQFLLKFLNV